MALVTDAGTPGVSDPGYQMVKIAHELGVRVGPIPGPSALTALASVSGLQESALFFRGFFPRTEKDQESELKLVRQSPWNFVLVWFESPQRIEKSLKKISSTLPDAILCVGKELTKLHEKLFFGGATHVSEHVASEVEREGELGEWVIGISVQKGLDERLSEWETALECLIDGEVGVATSVKIICQRFDVPKRTVYSAALKYSGKKD